jgi:hypothetical protein
LTFYRNGSLVENLKINQLIINYKISHCTLSFILTLT